MLGEIVDENRVSKIAGTHWWAGTDEIKLGRAAKKYNCEMRVIRRKNPLRAKRELLLMLKKGYPCLLCVDQWGHWITVVGAEREKFIFIDSKEAPVVCIDTWQGLKKRWKFEERDPDDPTQRVALYDLHPVIPKFRVKTKARFTLKQARYLRRPENRLFASHWDEYFTDLCAICTPRTPRSANVFPMGELLRRHGAMLRNQVAYWHGTVSPEQVSRILQNMKFVADTYDLVVRDEDEKRAIAAIMAGLSLWAARKYGVGEVYGT